MHHISWYALVLTPPLNDNVSHLSGMHIWKKQPFFYRNWEKDLRHWCVLYLPCLLTSSFASLSDLCICNFHTVYQFRVLLWILKCVWSHCWRKYLLWIVRGSYMISSFHLLLNLLLLFFLKIVTNSLRGLTYFPMFIYCIHVKLIKNNSAKWPCNFG